MERGIVLVGLNHHTAPVEVRERVVAALRSFDAANLRGIVAAALGAATDRAREMARTFGENSRK